MTLIESKILQEKQRIEFMLKEYSERLALLPKGTLYKSKRGNKLYYYLKYRDGKKIISRYIPGSDIDSIRSEVEARRHIIDMIDELKAELAIANRALGVKE